jgi:hypothetical protein
MFLPGAISRAILSALPPELGQYIVESGEGMQVRQQRPQVLDTMHAAGFQRRTASMLMDSIPLRSSKRRLFDPLGVG